MLHYDKRLGITSYFKPILIGVVNRVFKRNFEPYNTIQGLFSIPIARLSGWFFSFPILIISYIILLGGGYLLGTQSLVFLIVLSIPVYYLATYNIFFSAWLHAIALGIVITFLNGNLTLILIAMTMFFIGRLFIDIPEIKLMYNFADMHETIGNIYLQGFQNPMKRTEALINYLTHLQKYNLHKEQPIRAYEIGYQLSEDETYTIEEILLFINEVMESILDN